MDLDAMITTLRDSKKPLGELTLPSASGVYAVFLRDPECIPELHSNADFPVYVGRSSDLDRRALRQHLRPNASGSSTLRRSLGAILKGELGCAPCHEVPATRIGTVPTTVSRGRVSLS